MASNVERIIFAHWSTRRWYPQKDLEVEIGSELGNFGRKYGSVNGGQGVTESGKQSWPFAETRVVRAVVCDSQLAQLFFRLERRLRK